MKKWDFSINSLENSHEGTVNLTPLIDVVFVVLIMFILVAPIIEMEKISLAPATKEKKTDMISFQENAEIKIHVYLDNSIHLNGTLVTIEELSDKLKKAYQTFPSVSPQLYHDKTAYFGTYQMVKNAVESAGFESLDIILKSG